jgi:alkylated DNA repair dioxygenase AlkB
MQQDLFLTFNSTLEQLPLADADVSYMAQFIDTAEAEQLYQKLSVSLAWRQDTIKMFGREVKIPRLQAWYGDPEARYTYSGLHMAPNPWTTELWQIKRDVESISKTTFNSVLVNWYRDGQDSMGWHSDNEPELGDKPTIASLTLGQVRDFNFRRKNPTQNYRIALQNGSLLIMSGTTQQYWQHGISKRAGDLTGRINLTFRHIIPSSRQL